MSEGKKSTKQNPSHKYHTILQHHTPLLKKKIIKKTPTPQTTVVCFLPTSDHLQVVIFFEYCTCSGNFKNFQFDFIVLLWAKILQIFYLLNFLHNNVSKLLVKFNYYVNFYQYCGPIQYSSQTSLYLYVPARWFPLTAAFSSTWIFLMCLKV